MPNRVVHKAAILKAVDGENRDVRFIASTDAVDRYGDTVNPKGWITTNFDKNPVFLLQHAAGNFPIGKVTRTWNQANKFMADVSFMPDGMHDLADKAWSMVAGGFMNAVSVGFASLKREPIYDDDGHYTGTKFLEQELLELSLCSIPANPEALQVARSLHFSQKDMSMLFTPDKGDLAVEHSRSEMENLKLRLSD